MYINTVGVMCSFLFLLLPLNALIWRIRMKKNLPHASLLFGNVILVAWSAIFLYILSVFFTGAWYREDSGTSHQEAAITATLLLVIIIGLHLALVITARKRSDD